MDYGGVTFWQGDYDLLIFTPSALIRLFSTSRKLKKYNFESS